MHVATYAIAWFVFVVVSGLLLMLTCTLFACVLKSARAWWTSRRVQPAQGDAIPDAQTELPSVKWFVVANPDDELMVAEPA